MLSRIVLSLSVALITALAGVRPALAAASSPDNDEIVIGTFLLVLGVMFVLGLVYLIKWLFGLAGDLPPEEPASDAHGAHH